MRLLVVLLLAIFSTQTFASPCGDVIYNKHGMFRKYKYVNLDLSELTKKHGTTGWTSNASTETTTAVTDPGVTTGASSAIQQSLSTKGQCKWFGLVYVAEKRVQYIAQNVDAVKTELAKGQGHFTEVLMDSYFCNAKGKQELRAAIRNEYVQRKISRISPAQISQELDAIILNSPELSASCYSYVPENLNSNS